MSYDLFHSVRRTLCAGAFLLLAPCGHAIAAVTLIDQQAALLGRVTSDDTPGFPVTISHSGSYRLTGNLTVPDVNTTAILITADDVTLDLNGFAILGPNVCTTSPAGCTHTGPGGMGVLATRTSGADPVHVRVMNGTVRGMGFHGIRMLGEGASVEKVHAEMNGGAGIFVVTGSVVDSVADLNYGVPAAIDGRMVRGCIASRNVHTGLIVQSGVGIGNVAIGNGESGIGAFGATMVDNYARDNGGVGISASCPGVLIGNTATANKGGNIFTSGVAACATATNAQ